MKFALSLALAFVILAGPASSADYVSNGSTPTAEDYASHVIQSGGVARIVEPGRQSLAGHRVECGIRPLVLDPGLDDYAAAYPGFIIINPAKVDGLPAPVALWIYAHECGHQYNGPDEDQADCFASQRGRRQGWLTVEGVEKICNFISPSRGDVMHFAGPLRCQTVRRCFGAADNF